ncbi:hypothetical protein O7606_22535 [Micromonospora sp. WMMD882]|uniref:hypothetical protein n=1 Tax=Micromonospora sp. WMMD882 TaxID=3015151 RepID=UPI00248AE6FC|nr:hypothetical protein [Micromonospora sp. WMMD882]WBB78942.1 hypothetical protein O7606_22535 [Micromonospora sp. WMMD882]
MAARAYARHPAILAALAGAAGAALGWLARAGRKRPPQSGPDRAPEQTVNAPYTAEEPYSGLPRPPTPPAPPPVPPVPPVPTPPVPPASGRPDTDVPGGMPP